MIKIHVEALQDPNLNIADYIYTDLKNLGFIKS